MNNIYVFKRKYDLFYYNNKTKKDFFNTIHDKRNIYYLQGQSYENNENSLYKNISYTVLSTDGNLLDKITSVDGGFFFNNLDSEYVDLIAIDESNKYNGKYFKNIITATDYQKSLSIIQLNQYNNSALLKIVHSGDNDKLELISNDGDVKRINNSNIFRLENIKKFPYTITVYDFVEGDVYTLEKTYNKY